MRRTAREVIRDLEMRVARLERQADLMPPLGNPGGISHTQQRIEDAIHDEQLEDELIEQLYEGESIPNEDARKVYRFDDCNPISSTKIFKGFCVSAHGQYRMDQRGITVNALQGFFFNLEKYMERNKYNRLAAPLLKAIEKGWKTNWTDQYSKNLTVVFMLEGDSAKIITAYYKNKKDPRRVVVQQERQKSW